MAVGARSRCGEGSEPLVIFSQTQTRHARNICPRLGRLPMILARPPAPNTLLVTLCSLQIRQHRWDRLDIRRPRRDHQITITHFGPQASFVGPVRRNEEMYCGPVLRHPTELYVASRRPRWLSMAAAVQTGPDMHVWHRKCAFRPLQIALHQRSSCYSDTTHGPSGA